MSDFIQARFAASYAYTDEDGKEHACTLTRPLWLLTAAPERSWEHQTAQFNLLRRQGECIMF